MIKESLPSVCERNIGFDRLLSFITSMNRTNSAGAILYAYQALLELQPEEVERVGVEIAIPSFSEEQIENLLNEAKDTFRPYGHMIHLPYPVIVIGDLHGNFHDLLRIWSQVHDHYEKQFLFLGDYVDRGQYSIEIITLLLALRVQYPKQFHLLRGNHEFSKVNANYGFKADMIEIFGNDNLWSKVNETFNYLPLCADIGGYFFCVHGGISPHLKNPASIESIPYPLESICSELIRDLVWSDPTNIVSDFVINARGTGVAYGPNAMKVFFHNFGYQKIVRAHESIRHGIRDDGKVITVFSTSGYSKKNAGGYIIINYSDRSAGIDKIYYDPMPKVERSTALFSSPMPTVPKKDFRTLHAFTICQKKALCKTPLTSSRPYIETTRTSTFTQVSTSRRRSGFNLSSVRSLSSLSELKLKT